MESYGFDNQWIKWVMALVSTPSFSILMNGSPTKLIYPSRGIRQGDSLSPFLFILMMEGLIRTIKEETEKDAIKGLQPHHDSPPTMHQQFLNDTMLHGVPTVIEVKAYKEILDNFVEASRTEVNHSKSTIFSLILIFLFKETSLTSWVLRGKPYMLNIWEFLSRIK